MSLSGEAPGYYMDLLVQGGLITPDLEPHPDCPQEAMGLQINTCIVRFNTPAGVLHITRDLHPLFDVVNTATAMHRLAKLVKKLKVGPYSVGILHLLHSAWLAQVEADPVLLAWC